MKCILKVSIAAATFVLFFTAQIANAIIDPCSPLLGINNCTGVDCSFKYAVQDTITLPAVTQLPAIFDLNDSQLVPADACIPSGTKFSITGFSSQGYQYDYQAINVVPNTLNQILRPADVLRRNNIETVTVSNPHSNESSSSSHYENGYHQSASGHGRNPTSDKPTVQSSGVTFLMGATHSVSGFVADQIDPIPLINQQRAISGAGAGITIPIVRWMSSSAAHCNVQLIDSPQDKVGANETLVTYSTTNPAGTCDSVKSTSTCFAAVAPYFNSRPDIVGGPRPGFLATGSASVVPKQFSKCSSGCNSGVAAFGWLKTSEVRDFYKRNAFDCSKEKLSRTCEDGSLNPVSSDFTASFDQCVSSCKAGGAEVSLPAGVTSGAKCQLPLPDAAVSTIAATDVCCSGVAERICNSLDGSETISYRCLGGSPPAPDCTGGIISWTDSQTGKTCQGIRPTTPSGRSTGLIGSTTSGLNGDTSFACSASGTWELTGAASCGSTAPTCSGSFKWKQTCYNNDCANHSLSNSMAAVTTSGNFAKCLYSSGAASSSILDNSACNANQANSLALCKIVGVSTQNGWGGGAVTGHKCECDGTTTEQPKLCWQNTLVSPNSSINEWDCSMHYDKGGTCTTLNDKKPIGKCYNKKSKTMEMPPSSYLYCLQEEPGECWNPSDAKCVPRPTTVSQSTNISSLFKLPQYGVANNNATLRAQCEQACPNDESQSGCMSGCYGTYPDPIIMSQAPNNVGFASGHHGGGGGGDFSLACPNGKYITKISGRSGALLDSLQIHCNDGSSSARVGGGGGGEHSIACAAGNFLVGFRGRSGNVIDHLAGYCGNANSENAVFAGESNTHFGGGEFAFACPTGSYVYRIDGRSGNLVDSLKFYCTSDAAVGIFELPALGAANNNETLRNQCLMNCPSPKEGGIDCRNQCWQTYPTPRYLNQIPADVGVNSGQFGGGGGGPFSLTCPDGKFVTQILGRSGAYMDSIQLKCSDATSTARAGGGGGGDHTMACNTGQFLVGVRGKSGNYIDHLAGYCGSASSKNAVFSGQTNSDWGGGEFSFACPIGSYVYRVDGRSGRYIDALKFYCRAPGQTIQLEPGTNYCPEVPAPVQDACGDAVGQFIVRNVVTSNSNSSRRVMVTQKVHLDSYCSDNITNPPSREQKTVKWMIDYSTYGTCGLPAMPNWYDGGAWVGNNFPDYSLDGYYTVVRSANANFPHGHIRMNDFLNRHGVSFVQGPGETFDPSQLIICNRPPFTGGGGGGGGNRNYQVQQN